MARWKDGLQETKNVKACLDKNDYLVEEHDDQIVFHKIGAGLKKLYLEPTARCNLACITCVRRQWSNIPEGDLDMDLFESLVEQLPGFPRLERVHLGGFGEPLAHTQALQIIHRLAEAGCRISLSTNGTLLTGEVSEALIKSGVHKIYFSIDGVEEDVYGKIRSEGELGTVIGNIKNLRRLKQKMKVYHPKVALEFVLMRSNADQLERIPLLARELGSPEVLVTNLLAYSEEMYREVLYDQPGADRHMGAGLLAPPAWDERTGRIQLNRQLIWPAVEQDFVLWGTMRLPRMYWGSSRKCAFVDNDALAIRWDGLASPCYALMYSYPYILDNRHKQVSAYIVGDIKEQSLYDIWNNPEYVRFRSRVKNYRFPSCMDCSNNQSCDFAEANEDCWGNAPSCADCLWSQGIVRCP